MKRNTHYATLEKLEVHVAQGEAFFGKHSTGQAECRQCERIPIGRESGSDKDGEKMEGQERNG